MPESILHNGVLSLLWAILVRWARTQPNTEIARNLAIRWDKANPRIGLDPDVCVLRPAPPIPPEDGDLSSVRTWLPGHSAPIFAVEVVSNANPRKDYEIAPEKYAASGTRELCIFDPHLCGPRNFGGPYRLQLWQRDEIGRFERVYAGDGPVYCRALKGYLVVVDRGRMLRIAEDEAGLRLWPTADEATKEAERAREAERIEKEAERAAKEAERAAKEEALARVAVLEAALAKLTK